MIYVDQLKRRGKLGSHCHMMTDGPIEELHEMAIKINCDKSWFQNHRHPHYDLTPARRFRAVWFGAVEVTTREMLRRTGQASVIVL